MLKTGTIVFKVAVECLARASFKSLFLNNALNLSKTPGMHRLILI
jgi:hypothetical protein